MATEVAVVVGNYEGEPRARGLPRERRRRRRRPASEVDRRRRRARPTAAAELAERHGARFLAAPNLGLGYLYNRGVAAVDRRVRAPAQQRRRARARAASSSSASELDARRAAVRRRPDASSTGPASASSTRARRSRRGRLLREYIPGLHLDHAVPADDVVADGQRERRRDARRGARCSLELGGFDETFFMEWEDLDLCWRAWLRGWPSVYVPAAPLRHRVGAVTTDARRPAAAARRRTTT